MNRRAILMVALVGLASALASPASRDLAAQERTVLIRNGRVMDGTGMCVEVDEGKITPVTTVGCAQP